MTTAEWWVMTSDRCATCTTYIICVALGHWHMGYALQGGGKRQKQKATLGSNNFGDWWWWLIALDPASLQCSNVLELNRFLALNPIYLQCFSTLEPFQAWYIFSFYHVYASLWLLKHWSQTVSHDIWVIRLMLSFPLSCSE